MNILHIIPSLAKGGAERLVLDICLEFQNCSEKKVKLITFREDNSYSFLTENLDWNIVPSKVCPSISGKTEVVVKDLQRAIEDFKPDVIHSHLFETEMVLSQINYPKAKYIVHFHDNMIQYKRFTHNSLFSKSKLTNFYEKLIVLKSYKTRNIHFVAISSDGYRYINEVLPEKFKKTLLFNAVDTKKFKPGEHAVQKPLLCTIGSLVDKKGQDLAVKTIAELHNRGIYTTLNILGDGPNRNNLENLVHELKLENFVFFHGVVDYPENYLKESRIYLHTATYEPFGLVLLEAMASGLPVVCTDGKGNRDLIEQGKNGFMVLERTPELLAEKIEYLIRNTNEYVRISNYTRQYALKFDIRAYVDKLLTIYNNA